MTFGEVEKLIQIHFNNFTPGFKERIGEVQSMAIEMFTSFHEWEFMDKYVEVTVKADENNASLFIVDLPDDFRKVNTMWTRNYEIIWMDRKDWMTYQLVAAGGLLLDRYTEMDDMVYLSSGGSGEQIFMIYNRKPDSVDFGTIPEQYHAAVVAGMILNLTPAVLDGGQANVNLGVAHADFDHWLSQSLAVEAEHRGRNRRLKVPEAQRARAKYR